MYVNMANCYRVVWSVCLSVRPSVGWSVTLVRPAKTAELIKMPFGLRTRVAQGTMCYMGVQIPMRRGNFDGVGAFHCKV